MIDIRNAIRIAKEHMPDGQIQKYVSYKHFYVFVIFTPDPYEGEMDAFYSVNRVTGEFRDFPYLDEGIFEEIMDLFAKAPDYCE